MGLNKRRKFERIMTAAAFLVLLFAAWKAFGPKGSAPRGAGDAGGPAMRGLAALSVAVPCAGYLLWRFFSYIFFKKYFSGGSAKKG